MGLTDSSIDGISSIIFIHFTFITHYAVTSGKADYMTEIMSSHQGEGIFWGNIGIIVVPKS